MLCIGIGAPFVWDVKGSNKITGARKVRKESFLSIDADVAFQEMSWDLNGLF